MPPLGGCQPCARHLRMLWEIFWPITLTHSTTGKLQGDSTHGCSETCPHGSVPTGGVPAMLLTS